MPPTIKPGPGESWCPCCERMFTKTGAIYCLRPDCVPKQAAFRTKAHAAKAVRKEARKAEMATLPACPQCGGKVRHASTCPEVILKSPCDVCGRMFERSASGQDAMVRTLAIPAGYAKMAGVPVQSQLMIPLHARCKDWLGPRLRRQVAGLQPPWGVKVGLHKYRKVKASELPPPGVAPRAKK